MKQVKLYLACSILLLLAWRVHAEVRIEITQGMDETRPIGVVPFQWTGTGALSEDIGSIVAADLRNSGKFDSLDLSHLPQKPSTAQEVQPFMWSTLGIDAVVVGQVTSTQEQEDIYTVTYQLVDISGIPGSVLAKNSYRVGKQWLRYAGHAVSDEIFEKLTGIKGAFRTRIAYVMKTNTDQLQYELCVSDYDGHNQYTVHRSSQPLMSPAWSPDGLQLAYVTFESGRSALVIQTLSNGMVHQVVSCPGHNGAPAFSPDGTKLAFALSKTGSLNLYVMDISSGKIHQVTEGRSNNTEPTWFPDSQNLAFTSDQTGRPQVYKIDINGGNLHRITWEGPQNQNANVNFDGKTMVMVSTTDGEQHIAKQDLITGKVQILSSTFLDETPSLAPNGTMVVYSSFQKNKGTALNLVSTDGHFKSCFLTSNGQLKSPAWSPYL